jgi:hypothetical protein
MAGNRTAPLPPRPVTRANSAITFDR